MRAAAAFMFAAALTAAGGPADPPAGEPDRERMRGRWEVAASVDGGKAVPAEAGGTVVVTADKITLEIGDRKESFGYKLDPARRPRWLDLVADKTTVIPCIYEFDGDALRVRFPRGGTDRPTEFEPKAGATNVRLLTLKRSK